MEEVEQVRGKFARLINGDVDEVAFVVVVIVVVVDDDLQTANEIVERPDKSDTLKYYKFVVFLFGWV